MQFSREQLSNVFMQEYLRNCLSTSTDLQQHLSDVQPFCTEREFADLKDFNSKISKFNELINRDAKSELCDDDKSIVYAYEQLLEPNSGLPKAYRKKMYDNLLYCIDKHYMSNAYYQKILAKQVNLFSEDYECNMAAKQLIFHNKDVSDDFLALMHKIFAQMKNKKRFEYRDIIGLPVILPTDRSKKNMENPKNWSKEDRRKRLDVILMICDKINNSQQRIDLLQEGISVAENNGNSRTKNFMAKRDFCTKLSQEYAKINDTAACEKYKYEAQRWQNSINNIVDLVNSPEFKGGNPRGPFGR